MTLKLTSQTLTDNILNHIVHKSSADFYLSENLKVSDNENGNTQVQVPQTCAYVQYLFTSYPYLVDGAEGSGVVVEVVGVDSEF